MCSISENITQYLKSRNKLNKVARYVCVKNIDIHVAAERYKLTYAHLQRKVDIMKRFIDDFKLGSAFHVAVQNVLNGTKTIIEAAKECKIDPQMLNEEIEQYKKLGKKSYVYDKPINVNTGIFTFDEELLLLRRLSQRKKSLSCVCQICGMELLSYLAYELAQEKQKQYSKIWNKHKRADEEWLIDFEMIHEVTQ
ncbi:uncharacterized protein [Anoplolepis gracilipes]|uniref:uncharacterized protein isoform X2 n=1 Tax=Anoplolepis gracilipes TaxID=354296 RepID=UPI003BA18F25